MTAGRMMTTLGALTLGLAMAGAIPALAQSSAGGTATQGTGTAATGTGTGPANATPAPAGGNTQTGTAGTGSSVTTSQMNNAGGTHAMSRSSMHRNRYTGRMDETRTAARHSRGRGVSNANPDAQNGDIARLNDQSLQAAQQGHNFTPSGGSM